MTRHTRTVLDTETVINRLEQERKTIIGTFHHALHRLDANTLAFMREDVAKFWARFLKDERRKPDVLDYWERLHRTARWHALADDDKLPSLMRALSDIELMILDDRLPPFPSEPAEGMDRVLSQMLALPPPMQDLGPPGPSAKPVKIAETREEVSVLSRMEARIRRYYARPDNLWSRSRDACYAHYLTTLEEGEEPISSRDWAFCVTKLGLSSKAGRRSAKDTVEEFPPPGQPSKG